MTRPWLEPAPVSVPAALADAVGGHPLIAQTLVRRGITTPEAAAAFLNPAASSPTPAEALPGLLAAVERLEAACRNREPICVWGDFDVDGQTATALLVSALADLGAAVTHHIPVRATEGHGVNVAVLARVIAAGARVILTCDTGIAAVEAAAFARGNGVDFIITDHHDPPAVLPEALTIVNPKLAPNQRGPIAAGDQTVSPAALATMPGVGIACKLAEALYRRAGRPEATEMLLDLVALGIVADQAELIGDTRTLLQRGLIALRRTRRLGLQALMEAAELDPTHLTEDHIGFVLAPRLNALGRLADANVAVEFLRLGITDSAGREHMLSSGQALTRARLLAADLEALNARRKLLCDQVYAAAQDQLRRDPTLLEHAALVLAGPGWHPGVVGIVASRLVERYGKPTVLLSLPTPGSAEPARGSARSVVGINITAAIGRHAELLLNFGGHPMAAGLSLPTERIAEFRRRLGRTVAQMAAEAHVPNGLPIDGELPLGDLSPELVADLERLAPFGPGHPPLTLVSRDLLVTGQRAIGRATSHLLIAVEDTWGAGYEVIWWDAAGETLPEGRFDLAYTVRSQDYRGTRGIQITWIAARPAAGVVVRPTVEVRIEDLRHVTDPVAALRPLLADPATVCWAEGESELSGPPVRTRLQLTPAARLILWTTPPGPAELRQIITAVQPEVVYLFGRDPGLDRPEAFLQRLAGLVKHILRRRQGRARLSELAAALAAREIAVRQGLAWLAAAGHIHATTGAGDEMFLAPGDGVRQPELGQITAQLEALLTETAAYRRYFATTDPAGLARLMRY